ncbi:MAG: hypothetical protein HY556_06990 [Euryarchaeota archaeon]|nr:hypothetical protein [Euryarchaeota archaeon]
MSTRRVGEGAASSVVSFMVGMSIFILLTAGMMVFLSSSPGLGADATRLEAEADRALDLIISSGGSGQSGSIDWLSDPDNAMRFGLASSGSPAELDYRKLDNLRQANLTKDSSNRLLDYEEARGAMGLVDEDFHLRSYPIFTNLKDGRFAKLPFIKAAYVGDFEKVGGSAGTGYLVQYSTAVVDHGTFVDVNVTVTNNGTEDTVFQTTFDVPLKQGSIVDVQNTKVLSAGASESMALRLYKTTGWKWSDDNQRIVNVTITDTTKTVAQFTVSITSTMTSGGISGNSIAALVVDSDKSYYKNGSSSDDKARLSYNALNGTGVLIDDQGVDIYVYDAAGSELVHYSEEVEKNGQNRVDWDTPDGVTGRYNMTIKYGQVNASERLEVTDVSVGEFKPAGDTSQYEETSVSAFERSLLRDLLEEFKNSSYVDGGDLYPDIKEVMNNDFANNISRYNLVIVGSNIDQNAMTSASAKLSIRDWVLSGGALSVMGSDAQAVQWLQPLFETSIETASGGLSVPDPTHPILHGPEELNYLAYLDQGTAWRLKASDRFTHVITRQQSVGGSDSYDALAVSEPGSFGNGTIVLTTYRPAIITQPQDDLEGKKLVYNVLVQAYGGAFIDYGPPIPSDATVRSTTRLVTVYLPSLNAATIEARLTLYLFKVFN